MTGRHALLLGSAGFIGQHLARHLAARPDVCSVDLVGFHASGFPAPKAKRILQGSVDAPLLAHCDRPDVVFWAIGGSSVSASVRDPAADRDRTLPPLEALLRLLAGPWESTRLVFLSSAAVYGASGAASTATSAPLRPISPYGLHKAESERLIRQALAPGRFSIVRPFSVYGPGLARQLLWDGLEKLRRNELSFHGSGAELRDWVYISDLARMLVDIGLSGDEPPALLNAGTGTAVSVRELLTRLFAAFGSAATPVFAAAPRVGDPDELVASRDEQVPWHSCFPTALDEGLLNYCAWYRKVANL